MTTQDPYRRRPGHVLVNLVEAGRDLVHGVAGTRPGSRRRRNGGGISKVSRWVGDGINWLLEDDGHGLPQEAPWREPQPIHGHRSSRTSRMANEASGTETTTGFKQRSNGSGRRPLEVIPHPAPPLLEQAEPDPPFSRQDPSGSPRQGGHHGLSRPRPRSSRRIHP